MYVVHVQKLNNSIFLRPIKSCIKLYGWELIVTIQPITHCMFQQYIYTYYIYTAYIHNIANIDSYLITFQFPFHFTHLSHCPCSNCFVPNSLTVQKIHNKSLYSLLALLCDMLTALVSFVDINSVALQALQRFQCFLKTFNMFVFIQVQTLNVEVSSTLSALTLSSLNKTSFM